MVLSVFYPKINFRQLYWIPNYIIFFVRILCPDKREIRHFQEQGLQNNQMWPIYHCCSQRKSHKWTYSESHSTYKIFQRAKHSPKTLFLNLKFISLHAKITGNSSLLQNQPENIKWTGRKSAGTDNVAICQSTSWCDICWNYLNLLHEF